MKLYIFAPLLVTIAAAGCRRCDSAEAPAEPTDARASDAAPDAAEPALEPWVVDLGGEGEDQGLAVASGPEGLVVVAGQFSSELPRPAGQGDSVWRSRGGSDAFVAAWSREGEPRWSRAFGGPGEDRAQAVAAGEGGSVVATGRFQGTVEFDPGAGEPHRRSSRGSAGTFVVNLDPGGGVRWVKVLDGTGWIEGQALAVDPDGGIWVGGRFAGTIDFNPHEGAEPRSAEGDVDAFVARFTSEGELDWVRTFGGARVDEVTAIAALGDGAALAGHFSEEVDLDPGEGESLRRSEGFTDVFVMRLDARGELSWVRTFGGGLIDQAQGVAASPAGEVWAAGIFVGEVRFLPGDGGLRRSQGRSDGFVIKLDAEGRPVWVRTLGGESSDYAYGLAVSEGGIAVIAGRFGGTVDFDPGEARRELTSEGDEGRPDGFLLALDRDGRHRWSWRFGGPGLDRGRAVAFGPGGLALITGSFEGPALFPPEGDDGTRRASAGGSDVFVLGLDIE